MPVSTADDAVYVSRTGLDENAPLEDLYILTHAMVAMDFIGLIKQHRQRDFDMFC